ncbi:mechanosensitive ion channel family protein [[Eubacterium] cellulosolvens]
MAQQDLYTILNQVLKQIADEIITLIPQVILAIIITVITLLIIKIVNKTFGKLLSLIDLDTILKKLAKVHLPFSINNMIITIIDIGIILIALFGSADFFLGPNQLELMRGVLGYAARVISVLGVTIFTFLLFNVLIERIKIETRMRGYIIFILLILLTIMIIDLTNLSASTRRALEQGLSIGLGVSVGVFAIWFFFHEYLDKILSTKKASIEREIPPAKKRKR